MNNRNFFLLLMILTLIAATTGCIFHKPAFQGQILDRDTKEPIEGVVIIAVYEKTLHGLEPYTHPFHVREALTDKDGKFRIPSYTLLIGPLSTEATTVFTIYKPNYASISHLNLEDHFSGKKAREEEFSALYYSLVHTDKTIRFSTPDIVELPKMTTREERERSWSNAESGIHGSEAKSSDLPISFKMLEEGRRHLGDGE